MKKDRGYRVSREVILNNMPLSERKIHTQESILALICMIDAGFDALFLSPAILRLVEPVLATCKIDVLCAFSELQARLTVSEKGFALLLPLFIAAWAYFSKDAENIYKKTAKRYKEKS